MSRTAKLREHMQSQNWIAKRFARCKDHHACDCIAYERTYTHQQLEKIGEIAANRVMLNPALFGQALAIIQDIARGRHPNELKDRLEHIGLSASAREDTF